MPERERHVGCHAGRSKSSPADSHKARHKHQKNKKLAQIKDQIQATRETCHRLRVLAQVTLRSQPETQH